MIPNHELTQIHLLVFDLDGTLIDSQTDLALSVNAVREELGLVPLPHVTMGIRSEAASLATAAAWDSSVGVTTATGIWPSME